MLFNKNTKPIHCLYINHHEQGLAMVVVLMVSAIAATTTMAVALRSYNSYVNRTRQSLSDRAKEAAEAGLNILIENLNQDHPEWLIEPYNGDGDWKIRREATGGCRTSIESNPRIEGTSNTYSNGTEGRYKLARYSFQGNHFYGGVGSFEMEGEIRSSENKLLASAKIYQDMSIIAKRCNALPGDTSNQDSFWPGVLIGSQIDRFVNARAYVKGSDPMRPARVMCTQECVDDEDDWESDFPPEPTIGDVAQPPAQDPSDIEGLEDLEGMSSDEMDDLLRRTINPKKKDPKTKTYNCRSLKIPEDIPEHAKREIDGTWHIYFKGSSETFDLQAKSSRNKKDSCSNPDNRAIKIQGGAPVRLHLDSGLYIKSKTWIDTTEVEHAADFMILGTSKQRKKILIRGETPNGEPLKTFIWTPNSEVEFWGRKERIIEGAIWADELYAVGNNLVRTFDLEVPEDMPQLIYQRLGKEFGIGRRDYVAQGVSSWRSYGRTPD